MKKFIYLFLIFFIGCSDLSNTPTKQTETFFKKYQALDSAVLSDLDNTISKTDLNSTQKETYKDIMKKNYQNLTYEIKEEVVNGDSAVVTVKIEVTDFKKVIDDVNTYAFNNPNEFNTNDTYDVNLFNDYKLNKLKEAKEKVQYTLYITLTKVDNMWKVNELNDSIYEKINGVYNY